jgi:hypothetical protein
VIATPGWSDRICSRLADVVLLQQESLVRSHDRAVVVGELY